jgi:hypothetical protein
MRHLQTRSGRAAAQVPPGAALEAIPEPLRDAVQLLMRQGARSRTRTRHDAACGMVNIRMVLRLRGGGSVVLFYRVSAAAYVANGGC